MCTDHLQSERPSGFRSNKLSPVAAVPVTDELQIFPRSAWAGNDRPPVGELVPEEVRFLLVHHTAGRSDYTEDGAIAEMQGVYAFHTGPQKNWPDVCYNFFVDRFGRVFEARTGSLDGPVMADATGGNQGFSQLVCLLGDFTSQMPTPEALTSLSLTLTWIAQREGLQIGENATTNFVSRGSNRWPSGAEVVTNTIAGHRDMSQTACPGDTFYPYVTSTLRTDVAGLMATSPPLTPSTTAAPETTAPIDVTPETATNTEAPAPAGVDVQSSPSTTLQQATPTPIEPQRPGGGPLGTALNVVAGAGAIAVIGGLGWVIKRRMDNEAQSQS